MTWRLAISSENQGWFHTARQSTPPRIHLVVVLLATILAVAWHRQPFGLPVVYFLKQDVPVLCALVLAAVLVPRFRFGQHWESEIGLSRGAAFAGISALLVLCISGHWLVMFGYDLSRDEAMATFAADQLARGELTTSVPAEWQPFGRAMMPIFFNGRIAPELVWTSAYLPVNSLFQAIAAAAAHSSVANPLLLLIGLFALWKVACHLWPQRRDAAVVTVLLAATSSQLIVTAMTSYAMTGHFALNMVWLALFLRGDKAGAAGALLVGFLTTGLHQIHFHPMFVAPFLLWLGMRRNWKAVSFYGLGYATIICFWFTIYPAWLIEQAGPVTVIPRHGTGLLDYVAGKFGRLLDYPPSVWLFNLIRFVAWQNVILVPLVVGAVCHVLRTKRFGIREPLFPLMATGILGLILMVFQGHGWGYRYLSGLIGVFALLAGYGWLRFVPKSGPARAWIQVRCACLFALVVALPLQLVMARNFVEPYAALHTAAKLSSADVVLVDVGGGYYAQDIVQNAPDFEEGPKFMDLSFVPKDALVELCSTQRVVRIDRLHYRATEMREAPLAPEVERALQERRELLERWKCAPRMVLEI